MKAADRELLIRIEERLEANERANELAFKALDEKTDQILEQTTKTNGRVTVLEYYKQKMIGIWVAVVGIATILATLVSWILK